MSIISEVSRSYLSKKEKQLRRIAICTHAKFSVLELCRELIDNGSEVLFFPVDYSIDAQVLKKLVVMKVKVIQDPALMASELTSADAGIEDGARLSKLIKQYSVATKPGFYTVEQTSGGVRYFETHPPMYPVVNVAMSPIKLQMENSLATPEGILYYFTRETGTLLGGKKVLVIGYGSIGEGIARLARTAGATVTVYDLVATKRLYAKNTGYAVVDHSGLDACLAKQDVVFTATNTYQGTLLGVEQFLLMKNGVYVCNAGSGRGELVPEMQQVGVIEVHDAKLEIKKQAGHLKYVLEKASEIKQVTVLGEGFPLNLHLGEGTSHDAIEIVMALLMLAVWEGPASGDPGLHLLQTEIQEVVAEICMQENGSTKELQPVYFKSSPSSLIKKAYGSLTPFHNAFNNSAHFSAARVCFEPGTKTRGHYHKLAQEAYFVESGRAEIVIWPNENPELIETFFMRKGDYLLVPENYFHDVKVMSSNSFVCLVIASPPFAAWDQFFNTKELML